MLKDAVALKLELLTTGISYDDGFLDYYSTRDDLIEKRRAYGTGDGVLRIQTQRTPQEIFVDARVICPANFAPDSPWKLAHVDGQALLINGERKYNVSFPARPKCYGHILSNGDRLEKIVTVYGDTTLGIFSPGHCYYFNDNRQCKFCSLGPAREQVSDHRMKVIPELAAEATSVALQKDPGRYKRVLLNGGTIPNYDKGFELHTSILMELSKLSLPEGFGKHLISMPPKNADLFSPLAEMGCTLAMSLEIFDPKLFSEICPGKHQDYGRSNFLNSFEVAVKRLGHGNVYAGFVAGLEPVDSLIKGIEFFGEMGVVPAVAIFHPDAGSILSTHPRPSVSFLEEVGRAMARVYKKYNFRPFIQGSGRNALDTEAFLQGF